MLADGIGFLALVKPCNPLRERPAGLFCDAKSERNPFLDNALTITLRTNVVNEIGRYGVVWFQYPMLESHI